MDAHSQSQQLVVVQDDSEHYLTMPQQDFVDLYCQPIMDDTWIRTQDIVHMSDLVETEGGEKIKQEILHEHIQERAKVGMQRQDPILEGMLWQEQFMEDYQQSGEREQDTEQAVSYRARALDAFRARHPNRRASNAADIEAVLSPAKRAASGKPTQSAGASATTAASPHSPAADASSPAAAPEPTATKPEEYPTEAAAAVESDNDSVNAAAEETPVDVSVDKLVETPLMEAVEVLQPVETELNDPKYAELATPSHSTPSSPHGPAQTKAEAEKVAESTTQPVAETVDTEEFQEL